jgi:hypothetical protein
MKPEIPQQIFEKKNSNINLMKTHSAGVELLHADGLTDMLKLIVTFSRFGNAPKRRFCFSQEN